MNKYYPQRFRLHKRSRAAAVLALMLVLLPFHFVHAHEGETHAPKHKEDHSDQKTNEIEEVIGPIKESYTANVETIFKKSCFDCHSSNTNYPWYSNFPFAKQLIKSDTAEARKHLDMTDGLPFAGHGTMEEDLKAIKKSIDERTMPPLRYRFLHPRTKLSDAESKAVMDWVDESLKQMSIQNRSAIPSIDRAKPSLWLHWRSTDQQP